MGVGVGVGDGSTAKPALTFRLANNARISFKLGVLPIVLVSCDVDGTGVEGCEGEGASFGPCLAFSEGAACWAAYVHEGRWKRENGVVGRRTCEIDHTPLSSQFALLFK